MSNPPTPLSVSEEERLDDYTERLLAQIPRGDTGPLYVVDALRQRIRTLIEEARKPIATLEEIDMLRFKAPYMSKEFRDLLNSLADRLEKTHPLAKVIPND